MAVVRDMFGIIKGWGVSAFIFAETPQPSVDVQSACKTALLGKAIVEAVQERGHVLAVDAGHTLKTPRTICIPVAL